MARDGAAHQRTEAASHEAEVGQAVRSGQSRHPQCITMKVKSYLFLESKPGTPGRRLTRNLIDAAIARAKNRSSDTRHQLTFRPRWRTKLLMQQYEQDRNPSVDIRL